MKVVLPTPFDPCIQSELPGEISKFRHSKINGWRDPYEKETLLTAIVASKLFIAIPNHNAIEREYFNEHWIAYDAPRHLYHFNYSTVKLFLEKNNIKVVKVYRMYLDTIYNILYSKSSYNFFYKIFIIIKSIFKIFINKEVSSSMLIVCKK